MISIRKFVGYAKVMAVAGALLMLAVFTETAAARSMEAAPDGAAAATTSTFISHLNLSPACTAALDTLKTAFVNDRQEDADERLNPDTASDPAEDAAEVAHFKALFATVRAACAADVAALRKPTATRTVTKSAACTSAVQAFKTYAGSLWRQGTRPTEAQVAHLKQLGQAARTACGWTWSTRGAWHR
jgi:hypothetical protein